MSQSDIEQLASAFGETTRQFLEDSERKAELARAMNDREALIKQQIKMEVLQATRMIFERNYKSITGEEPWRQS